MKHIQLIYSILSIAIQTLYLLRLVSFNRDFLIRKQGQATSKIAANKIVVRKIVLMYRPLFIKGKIITLN